MTRTCDSLIFKVDRRWAHQVPGPKAWQIYQGFREVIECCLTAFEGKICLDDPGLSGQLRREPSHGPPHQRLPLAGILRVHPPAPPGSRQRASRRALQEPQCPSDSFVLAERRNNSIVISHGGVSTQALPGPHSCKKISPKQLTHTFQDCFRSTGSQSPLR